MRTSFHLVACFLTATCVWGFPSYAAPDAPVSAGPPAAPPASVPPPLAAPSPAQVSVGSGIEVVPFPASEKSQEDAKKAALARAASAAKTNDPPVAEPVASLRNEIRVPVIGLPALIEEERVSTTKAKIVLFLDGRPIFNARPYPPLNPADGKLAFVLQRDESSRETWTHLLGKPTFDDREVEVSVGLSDQFPKRTEARIKLRPIPRSWFFVWLVVLVGMLGGFIVLASRSEVLRDIGPAPAAGERKPYSLAKMQAMWWFFLILASYLFVGMITGDYGSTINSTVLSLMGISVATTVGGAIIDTGSAPAAATVTKAADSANATAASAAHAANEANSINSSNSSATTVTAAAAAATAASLAASAAVSANAAATAAMVGPDAKTARPHWWLDILSDDNGVNFHRFQMVAWTLVLGIIFVHDVYVDLAMPVFDATLLGLLGISAGTYLGLKVTSEK